MTIHGHGFQKSSRLSPSIKLINLLHPEFCARREELGSMSGFGCGWMKGQLGIQSVSCTCACTCHWEGSMSLEPRPTSYNMHARMADIQL